mmetsp:Transcript_4456/g.7325  ORF Transcript_4456/g.7325 Transcript_4456/m.7325 type:complete len:83 (-) Transcript_4456:498-746(-)
MQILRHNRQHQKWKCLKRRAERFGRETNQICVELFHSPIHVMMESSTTTTTARAKQKTTGVLTPAMADLFFHVVFTEETSFT